MKSRAPFLFIMILSLLFLSGCSSEGLNEKLIIHGIGVDKGEDKYTVTMHVLNTNASSDQAGDTPEEIQVFSGTGHTLLDAITNIEKASGKKVLYSHNLVLIVGKQTAEFYIDKVLQFFSSDHSLRPSVEILVSQTSAKDVLNVKNNDKLITADDIMGIIGTSYNKEDRLKFTLKGFIGDMKNKYKSAKAFCISSSQNEPESEVLKIGNMAVFEDDVMKGVLTEEETKGFLIISGKVKDIEQDIEVDGNSLSCLVKNSKCVIKTSIENEVPQFDIYINATANVYNDSLKSNSNIKKELEKKLCELAEKSINKALREYKCDIFNFSRHLMNASIDYFKYNEAKMNDILVHAKYNVNAKTKVNYMGKNSSLFEE